MSNAQRILLIIAVLLLLAGGVIAVLFFTGAFNPPETSADPAASRPSVSVDPSPDTSGETSGETSGTEEEVWSENWTQTVEYDTAVFSEYDRDTDFSDPDATIVCDGANAKVTGTGAIAANGTISISESGTYVLEGNYRGRILIQMTDTEKAHLVFNNFSVTCASYSPILCTVADKVCVTLADGTVNEINDNGTGYVKGADLQEEIEGRSAGALHAKCDLTVNGNGTLRVNATYRHGIFSKNDLRILSGRIEVNCPGSAVKGKKSITIGGGSIRVTSEGDAFKVTEAGKAGKGIFKMTDGVLTAETKADGIDALTGIVIEGGRIKITASDHALVTDGSVTVGTYKSQPVLRLASTAGGKGIRGFSDVLIEDADITVTQSSEAIVSATGSVTVRAGKLHLCALDEGLESVGNMILSGGQIWIEGEGGGISCDKKLSVTGGTLFIDGPTGGDGGIVELNYGNGVTGTWNQTDGMLIGLGNPAEENEPTSRSEGRVLHIEGTFTSGTIYAIREQGGDLVAAFTPAHDSSVLLIALPMSAKGKTYEILSGLEADGDPSYGFYGLTDVSGGTVLTAVTASDVYTEAVITK
ncbi:MAG: carbohydrate-binding domain-containing protein [Clostridia bacterium]|nr:carbohydrate-binding domain-containing protein [Clostridia bacterium]